MNLVFVLPIYPYFSETFIINEFIYLKKLKINGLIIASSISKAQQPMYQKINWPILKIPPTTKSLSILISQIKFFFHYPLNHLKALSWLIKHLSHKNLTTFLRITPIAHTLNQQSIDLIYGHYGQTAITCLLFSILTNKPFGITLHNQAVFETTSHLEKVIEQSAFTILKSNFAKKQLISKYQLKHNLQKKLKVIRTSGVDLSKFSPQYPRKFSTFTIISVARLVPTKGLSYLIKACHLLKQKNFAFKYLIIGQGPEKNNLQKLVSQLNLINQVKFLSQIPHGKKLNQLIEKSHLFALPCLIIHNNKQRDILPNAVQEAMALKQVVITSKMDGITELIKDEKNGFLIPQKDSKALAKTIIRISQLTKKQKQVITTAARTTIKQKFNTNLTSQQLIHLFNQIS